MIERNYESMNRKKINNTRKEVPASEWKGVEKGWKLG